jgi:hypothetical protein
MSLDPDNYWKNAQNDTPQGASELKAMLGSRRSHKELLSLIGEIDGIDLRSLDNGTVEVFLRIGGREIELIRDSGSAIIHSLTRIGIACCLQSNVAHERPSRRAKRACEGPPRWAG